MGRHQYLQHGLVQHTPQRSSQYSFLDIPLANGSVYGSYFSSSSQTTTLLQQPISPLRLTTPREDVTRVRLHKQRLSGELHPQQHHHATAIISGIPGLKTSAAFFASLRTNLRLVSETPASPASTPPSMRGSATSLPPPSPLSQAIDFTMESADGAPVEDPLAGVPELKTYKTEDPAERVAALKLVADSVAQMRQTANNTLITHPINSAFITAIIAILARYVYESRGKDIWFGMMAALGVLGTAFTIFRYITQPYLSEAEKINWAWLGDADIIVTKFGEEVIGTVMIQWLSGDSRQKRKKAWRGEIKAWTVRLKYRRKGVGGALLEEAVKEARKKGAEGIEFAEEHANHKRLLPSFYNRVFDKREEKGRELLQDLFETSPGRGKKK